MMIYKSILVSFSVKFLSKRTLIYSLSSLFLVLFLLQLSIQKMRTLTYDTTYSEVEKIYRKRFNLMDRPAEIGEECNLGIVAIIYYIFSLSFYLKSLPCMSCIRFIIDRNQVLRSPQFKFRQFFIQISEHIRLQLFCPKLQGSSISNTLFYQSKCFATYFFNKIRELKTYIGSFDDTEDLGPI